MQVNAAGGAYVGSYVQIVGKESGSRRGYALQFKGGKYTIKPENGGESYKMKLDGSGSDFKDFRVCKHIINSCCCDSFV